MTGRYSLPFVLAFALQPSPIVAQTLPPPPERQLARDIFQQLVEINTVGDSGTTRAATALAQRLASGGFPAQDVMLVGGRPTKQNLVVRLRGKTRAEPILFLAHLDVVEARSEDWSVEPFRLTERDGYFYGRGTLDIKNEVSDLVGQIEKGSAAPESGADQREGLHHLPARGDRSWRAQFAAHP
jgi:hypothetical protein